MAPDGSELLSLIAMADDAYQSFRANVIDLLPLGASVTAECLNPHQREALARLHSAERALHDYRCETYAFAVS
jgi:hypothetical protein